LKKERSVQKKFVGRMKQTEPDPRPEPVIKSRLRCAGPTMRNCAPAAASEAVSHV
jgi:hypothetical protein